MKVHPMGAGASRAMNTGRTTAGGAGNSAIRGGAVESAR
ncbi:MAG: hypothetical protein JWP79_2076 [Polaromonas sp.]|jgi:hypothetical protein|nr:hypothetical protein [Polaromonas sp.]